MVADFHEISIGQSDDVPLGQDLPARARQILAKPGIITGADALELRDLSSTLYFGYLLRVVVTDLRCRQCPPSCTKKFRQSWIRMFYWGARRCFGGEIPHFSQYAEWRGSWIIATDRPKPTRSHAEAAAIWPHVCDFAGPRVYRTCRPRWLQSRSLHQTTRRLALSRHPC